MTAMPDQAVPGGDPTRDTRPALNAGWTRLQKRALTAVGYAVFAYLLLRLLPAFKQAVHSLEHVSWAWIVGALALEVLSEHGSVRSWRGIVDPNSPLAADGRGRRSSDRSTA